MGRGGGGNPPLLRIAGLPLVLVAEEGRPPPPGLKAAPGEPGGKWEDMVNY